MNLEQELLKNLDLIKDIKERQKKIVAIVKAMQKKERFQIEEQMMKERIESENLDLFDEQDKIVNEVDRVEDSGI